LSNFTDVATGLPFMVVMFTLLLTLIGVLLARRANIETTASEPWSMTNLESNLWLLQRHNPVLATIHGIIIEESEHIDTPKIEGLGFNFMNPANMPSKSFKKGSNILIRINPRITEPHFILYYEEHKKQSNVPEASAYDPNMNHEGAAILPSNIKAWKANLY
jgi:hypothetical protein